MASRPSPRKRNAPAPRRSASHTPPTADVEPSARYTGPKPARFRVRPGWHKVVGITSIVSGFALFIICQLNVFGIHDFGGHIWYLVGFGIAASGTWWLGLFDPPAPRPRPR